MIDTSLLHPTQSDRRVMRLHEVEKRTGFKRSHLYNLMKDGKFPHTRRIGLRAVGWDSQEVEQWINDQLAQD
ncbi:helix-turn-helix transcriptional regulator [Pseudomonas sp. LRF_L74]|uniref:helix-turn-helix transcriptional regulator n=1 Tax=Pseudomonas sp. LRF_L74 TaxID=3369422 RepID=UPI003F640A85